jgi:hypothetical protein
MTVTQGQRRTLHKLAAIGSEQDHELQFPEYTQTYQHGETMTEALNFILWFFRQRKPWVAGLRHDGRKPGMAPSGSFSAAFNVTGGLVSGGFCPF